MKTHIIQNIINTTALDKIDIKVLLRHVLGLTSAQLIMQYDRVLTDTEYNTLQDFIAKRSLGMPVSYLLKYKEFYSRKFLVNEHTLIPRPETELLVDQVLYLIKQINQENQQNKFNDISNIKLLDLGTGSGCIAITCKLECPNLDVTATDISFDTLKIAQENARRLNANVSFKLANWYTNETAKFDIIVSNPPYIAKDDVHLANLQYEPLQALTDNANGLKDLTRIITGASKHLENCGYLIVEHGYNQKQAVCKLFKECGFYDIITVVDYSNLDRITYGHI